MSIDTVTFEATVVSDPTSVTVRVFGEIDIANASALQEVLANASASGRVLIVDMAGVTFMDASGMGALIVVRNQVDEDHLVLQNLAPNVARAFEAAGLADHFEIALLLA